MDDNKALKRAEIIAAMRDFANIYEHDPIAYRRKPDGGVE